MRRRRSIVVGTVAALVILGFAGPAQADSGSGRGQAQVVQIQDRCDPATFTAAGVPCAGDGDTTFADFLAEVAAKGSDGHWRFHPDKVTINAGQSLRAANVGGELHTFTRVDGFQLGCIPVLNRGGVASTDPRCAPVDVGGGVLVPREFLLTGVAPGQSVTENLSPGTYRFQCFVHPWMRTTVTVRR